MWTFPRTCSNGKFEIADDYLREPGEYRRSSKLAPTAEDVKKVAELLTRSERPLIHVGSGVVHAQAFQELLEVAEQCHVNVSTSWGARGALPETHELSLPTSALSALDEARKSSDLGPRGRLTPRRDGLLGQSAVLGPPWRAALDPGG